MLELHRSIVIAPGRQSANSSVFPKSRAGASLQAAFDRVPISCFSVKIERALAGWTRAVAIIDD
jgi:hypothetical protein